jgi:hypothetical protein
MLPKTGNRLHRLDPSSYSLEIGKALRAELGGSHRAIKTLMRWTGASERTAKNWLAGAHAPSGCYLIILVRESNLVARTVFQLAGRLDYLNLIEVAAARDDLASALGHIEAAIGPSSPYADDDWTHR